MIETFRTCQEIFIITPFLFMYKNIVQLYREIQRFIMLFFNFFESVMGACNWAPMAQCHVNIIKAIATLHNITCQK